MAEAALASRATAQGGNTLCPAEHCISVEHEAFALAARSACLLAAPLALCAARGSAAIELDPGQLDMLIVGVQDAVWGLTAWAGSARGLPLPVGQVLVAQPHRLLAAVAQLLRRAPQPLPSLAGGLLAALVAFAAHEHLSSRLRGWLAPPPSQAGGGGGAGAERGCLREAVQGAVPCMLQLDPRPCGMVLALLKLAAGDGGGGRAAAGDGSGASGGDAFRSAGRAMADQLSGIAPPAEWTTLPDGSSTVGLLGLSAQLLRLRVCGNPRCDNFGAASEEELPLKKCSGCMAVRYCRAECQKAHWQAAHKVECAQLASRG
ncbi:hypothetical protein TSOC_014460 [Tetrabaena socialis]|uniref:phytol kinase n=1 Tax=Tetrabaena socialis TaxID=47790 RepID=A0A2J7ZHM7_9CHLO|nr:hypothetical protein TSOC_014460 [Tetrabaena socialis]|eukprot:PNG99757.1 hypothetical protein TSOC_014460 [Tetrabaena socialis]